MQKYIVPAKWQGMGPFFFFCIAFFMITTLLLEGVFVKIKYFSPRLRYVTGSGGGAKRGRSGAAPVVVAAPSAGSHRRLLGGIGGIALAGKADALLAHGQARTQPAAHGEAHTQVLDGVGRDLLGRFAGPTRKRQAEGAQVAQAHAVAVAQGKEHLLLQGGEHRLDVVLRHGTGGRYLLGYVLQLEGIDGRHLGVPLRGLRDRVLLYGRDKRNHGLFVLGLVNRVMLSRCAVAFPGLAAVTVQRYAAPARRFIFSAHGAGRRAAIGPPPYRSRSALYRKRIRFLKKIREKYRKQDSGCRRAEKDCREKHLPSPPPAPRDAPRLSVCIGG